MYTGTVKSAELLPNSTDVLHVIVTYTDGTETFDKEYDWLADFNLNIPLNIKTECAKLDVEVPDAIAAAQALIGTPITKDTEI